MLFIISNLYGDQMFTGGISWLSGEMWNESDDYIQYGVYRTTGVFTDLFSCQLPLASMTVTVIMSMWVAYKSFLIGRTPPLGIHVKPIDWGGHGHPLLVHIITVRGVCNCALIDHNNIRTIPYFMRNQTLSVLSALYWAWESLCWWYCSLDVNHSIFLVRWGQESNTMLYWWTVQKIIANCTNLDT